MQQARHFCQEMTIQSHHEEQIASFWHNRNKGQFIGRNGLRLDWCSFSKQEHKKAIILVNGRTESTLKYQEVFYDLFLQGYDVYSYDHRGQGNSQRLILGSDIGHVVEFEHYVHDLESFVELVSRKKSYQSTTLLAHSMGGAIATLFAAKNPNSIDKLVLCAPMFGIFMAKWLQLIAKPLARFIAYFQHPANYALGQGPYKEHATEMALLTHSKTRFMRYRKLYEENEQIQVGGPSMHWLWQSLKIEQAIFDAASQINLPILLLQGGEDKIVSNQAMFKFHHLRLQAKLPIQFEIQASGRHELLFEQDGIRDTVLNLILDFAEQ